MSNDPKRRSPRVGANRKPFELAKCGVGRDRQHDDLDLPPEKPIDD
jgi:hypothetical protein